jgi:heptosyltransferase II
MFEYLQIANRRERALVAAADVALTALTWPSRLVRRSASARRRILVFRFERTGDLIMARPALAALRSLAPDAHIELGIGSWNRGLAGWLPEVDRVSILDLPWLARGGSAARDWRAEVRRWRAERFDTGINLEGDIRSHLLLRATGIPDRFGFDMAGGGPVLTHRIGYDPSSHVADNCVRLIEHVFSCPPRSLSAAMPPLLVPAAEQAAAADVLRDTGPGPLIGVHPCGGRPVKQWDLAAMARAVTIVAARLGGSLVITGGPGERAIADELRGHLPPDVRVIDLVGQLPLGTLAAVLARLTIFVSPDTGPMHLAAALGTPTVGIFGPSDPRRWGPLGPATRVVRSGIWCSPCNLIRQPPARCTGHVPDCLAAVTPDMVADAAFSLVAPAELRP